VTAPILIWIAGVIGIALVGVPLTIRAMRHATVHAAPNPRFAGLLTRWHRTRHHLRHDIGVPGAGLLVGAAGAGITFAIGWPLGRLAHAAQSYVDVPVFHWFQQRLATGTWGSLQAVLTQMGNRPEIKVIAVVAAIVLGCTWRRRWWVPVLVIAAAFVVEKYVAAGLGKDVLRGHPPTTHGTYPSGGCARLISIYGTILYLAIRTWRPPTWLRGTLWTLLAEAAWMEGFARTSRLEHWSTDVVGGWVVGILLLGTFVLTASAMAGRRIDATAGEAHAESSHNLSESVTV
jgi:hypothetical protein